jgi:hypothetical protein
MLPRKQRTNPCRDALHRGPAQLGVIGRRFACTFVARAKIGSPWNLLADSLDHLIAEQNAMRDDLPVLTTTGLRLEGAANDQLHAPRAYPRRA